MQSTALERGTAWLVGLRVIREALGHTSLQTTSVYVSLAREVMDQALQANAL
jgi:site-specific recombinase XerD